ncbi:unnamed protein product (mitochondrion) [Plasmodiophora brassicae]|uniref:Uncharacterized protein n=1 Tax=Plasmodiophora brassicae TaxID=37360 RepID=A0A3P3YBC9_PLABS|nr:unnamed protein product [Plasmodiophora brassicae]
MPMLGAAAPGAASALPTAPAAAHHAPACCPCRARARALPRSFATTPTRLPSQVLLKQERRRRQYRDVSLVDTQKLVDVYLGDALLQAALDENGAHDDFEEGVRMYADGDYEQAFALWDNAARHGHAMAMSNVAACHLLGRGTFRNEGKAVQGFDAASRLGSELAMHNLGVMFEAGLGVPADPRRATRRAPNQPS